MTKRLEGYSRLQIGLHWVIVLLVAVQLVIAENMTEMVDAIEEGHAVEPGVQFFAGVHYWFGILILLLMLARLVARFMLGAPAHAGEGSPALSLLSTVVHLAFYAALIVSPVVGLLAFYFGGELGDLHQIVRPVLIGLVGLHVLGALFNQFVRRDGTLTRMIRSAP